MRVLNMVENLSEERRWGVRNCHPPSLSLHHVMVPRIGYEIFEALNKTKEGGLKKIL